jgi:GH24 family phage-related lysozyme (muramidase)
MIFEQVKERIKKHEGFRNTVYLDSLGKATIGYGHLITKGDNFIVGKEYSKEELDALFDKDFDTACDQAIGLVGSFNICEDALGVVIEMVFQLGIGGVSKFKNMLEALRESDYANAAVHILASNWHKQTPKRCEELAEVLRTCADIN